MISKRQVKRYCCEDISKIENYDKAMADTTQTWECHHRMELIETGAIVDSTQQDLKDWGIYYNRPADELIFLTHKEHLSLHHRSKPRLEEIKRKISETLKGKPHSEEMRRKLSEVMKSKMHGSQSEEWKRKMSKASKADSIAYKEYKANGGTMKWKEFRKQRKVS